MTNAAESLRQWIVKAKDTSAGTHPTGWVSGQLWSVTSSQWQTMQATEFANARDTSGGAHPTGWVNGQFWSTTSSQWQSMYNTAAASAATWQANANTAYDSGTWGIGIPWSTRFTNANPPALTSSVWTVSNQTGIGASSYSVTTNGVSSDALGLNVDTHTFRLRAGTWIVLARGRFTGTGTGRLKITTSANADVEIGQGNVSGTDPSRVWAVITIGSGTADYNLRMAADSAVTMVEASLTVYFVPTTTTPHFS
jgi:hypothetical protein